MKTFIFILLLSCLPSAYAQVTRLSDQEMNGITYARFEVHPEDEHGPELKDFALVSANLAVDIVGYLTLKSLPEHQDKIRHALAGHIIANTTTGLFQVLLPNDLKHVKLISALMGFGTSALVGVGKEVWDSFGHGHVEATDALVTALGGVSGSITISFSDVNKLFKHGSHEKPEGQEHGGFEQINSEY